MTLVVAKWHFTYLHVRFYFNSCLCILQAHEPYFLQFGMVSVAGGADVHERGSEDNIGSIH